MESASALSRYGVIIYPDVVTVSSRREDISAFRRIWATGIQHTLTRLKMKFKTKTNQKRKELGVSKI